MSSQKTLPLRIFYTINSTLQYILARSRSPVSVTLYPDSQGHYGSVLLRTCLETICRSSPEINQDATRDYSIYVLDPLESNSAPAPVQIANTETNGGSQPTEQPRGVAVGLGLMSWAMTSDDRDAMMAMGTIVKQGTPQEALEVIFALRETAAMKQPSWNLPSTSSLQAPPKLERSASTSTSCQSYPTSQNSSTSGNTMSQYSASTREIIASIQSRSKPKPPKAKVTKNGRHPNTQPVPVTESDKLMSAETYIGPERKRGRPKINGSDPRHTASIPVNTSVSGSSSSANDASREVIVLDGSDSDNGTPSTPTVSTFSNASSVKDPPKRKRPSSAKQNGPPFTTNPLVPSWIRQATALSSSHYQPVLPLPAPPPPPPALPAPTPSYVPVKTEPVEPTVFDLLSLFSAGPNPEANAQNAALLAALTTIDSTDAKQTPVDNSANTALVSALKTLLSACAKTEPAPAPDLPTVFTTPSTVQPEVTRHTPQSSSNGSIVLDKENVNPTPRRKPEGKGLEKSVETSTAGTSSAQVSRQGSLTERAKSNDTRAPKHTLRPSASLPISDNTVRKRTLSDFMDEKEGKSKDKGKERERVEKRDGHRHQKPNFTPDALRHYPSILASKQPRAEQPSNYYRTPLEPWTSPARPSRSLNEDGDQSGQADTDTDKEHTSPTPSGSRSHKTPPKHPSPRSRRETASSPVRGPGREVAKKKYIVPEWARTNTATQPRLSEEAKRALTQAEEKKKEERANARKLLAKSRAKTKQNAPLGGPTMDPSSAECSTRPQIPRKDFIIPRNPNTSKGPVAASSDGPLIAFPLSSSPPRPSSPPPKPLVVPRTPKTPSKDRSRPTPGGMDEDSLFTPVMHSGGLFGSIFGSGLSQKTPSSASNRPMVSLPPILTSPLGNRKKAKISPNRSLLTGRGVELTWGERKTSPTSSPRLVSPLFRSALKGRAALQDSNMESDEFDGPSNSQGTVSSDADPPLRSETSGESVEGDEQQESGVDADADIDVDDSDMQTPVTPVRRPQHWAGLPPSSPPPPSSPVRLPDDSQTEEDDEMGDLPIANSDSELDEEMSTTTTLAGPEMSHLSSFFQALPPANNNACDASSSSTLDLFDQFTTVNAQSDDAMFGDLGLSQPGNFDPTVLFDQGLEGMDMTGFWEAFEPLLDQAKEAGMSMTGCEQPAVPDMFGTSSQDQGMNPFGEVDHAKLAKDMQALLSGCLM